MVSGSSFEAFFIGPNVAPLLLGIAAIAKSLAWPVVTVVTASFFRNQIAELSSSVTRRLISFKLPGGIEGNLVAEQAQLAATKPAQPLAFGPLPNPAPAVARIESNVQKLLEDIPSDEQVTRLTRSLAVQTLNFGFAVIYAIIFGSQIKGLIELRARRSVTAGDAAQFFQPYFVQYPQLYESYGFVGWVGFLIDKELIELVEGNRYQITAIGDEFLAWMESMGLSPEKVG